MREIEYIAVAITGAVASAVYTGQDVGTAAVSGCVVYVAFIPLRVAFHLLRLVATKVDRRKKNKEIADLIASFADETEKSPLAPRDVATYRQVEYLVRHGVQVQVASMLSRAGASMLIHKIVTRDKS